MKPHGIPPWASVVLLSGLLGLVGIAALAIGSVSVPFERTIAILLHQLHLTDDVTWTPMQATIILQVRFPRVLMAALVGGGSNLVIIPFPPVGNEADLTLWERPRRAAAVGWLRDEEPGA